MEEGDKEIATLNKQKLLLESVIDSTIYNVSSRMYYQCFTFKSLDYTKNIGFSLIFCRFFPKVIFLESLE